MSNIGQAVISNFDQLQRQGEQRRRQQQQAATILLGQQLQRQRLERQAQLAAQDEQLFQYLQQQTRMPLDSIRRGFKNTDNDTPYDIVNRMRLIRDRQNRQRKERQAYLADMTYQNQLEQTKYYDKLNQNLMQIAQNTRKKQNMRRQKLQRRLNTLNSTLPDPQQQAGQYEFPTTVVPPGLTQQQQDDYVQKVQNKQKNLKKQPRQALINKNRSQLILAKDPITGTQQLLEDIQIPTRNRQPPVLSNTNALTNEINENVKEFINENKNKVQRAFKFQQLLNQQIKMDEQQTIEDFKQQPSRYFDFLFNPNYYGRTSKIQFLNLADSIHRTFGKTLTDDNLNEKFKNAVIKQVKYPTGIIAKHIQYLQNLIRQGNRNAIIRLKKVRQMLNFKQWGGFIFDLSKIMTYPYELINGVRQLKSSKSPQLGFQIDNGSLKLFYNVNNKTRPVNALQFNHNFLKNILRMRNRVMNSGIKNQYAITQKDKELKNAFEAKYLS